MQYFDGEWENPSDGLKGNSISDATAVATLDSHNKADIGIPSFALFSGDPLPSLASPLFSETRASYANQLPEPTLSLHPEFICPQSLLSENKISNSSSIPFAETSAPRPASEEPSPGLDQDTHTEGLTTGFELKKPGQRAPTPDAASRSLSTTSPARIPCSESGCNKSFSRNHELRYVL